MPIWSRKAFLTAWTLPWAEAGKSKAAVWASPDSMESSRMAHSAPAARHRRWLEHVKKTLGLVLHSQFEQHNPLTAHKEGEMVILPLSDLAASAAAGSAPLSASRAPPIAAYSAPPAPGASRQSPPASGPVLSLAEDAVAPSFLCPSPSRKVGRQCSPFKATASFACTDHAHSTGF